MTQRNSWILAVILAFLLVQAAAAVELRVIDIGDESDFARIDAQIAWVAEFRIGDGSAGEAREIGLGPARGAPEASIVSWEWPRGEAVPFTLSYGPGSGMARVYLGEILLEYFPLEFFTHMFIRTEARISDASIGLGSVSLGGASVAVNLAGAGPSQVRYFALQRPSGFFGFGMDAEIRMDWDGETPTADDLSISFMLGVPGAPLAAPAISVGSNKARYAP